MSKYKVNRWKVTSEKFRAMNPLCLFSQIKGFVKACDLVDHIIPIESGGSMYDSRNFQPLSHSEHRIKTKKNEKGYILEGIETKNGLIPSFFQFIKGGECSKLIEMTFTTSFGRKVRTHDSSLSKTNLKLHVIGNVGSGKTTAAQFLSRKLNIPILSIDNYRKQINKSRSLSGEYHSWDIMFKDSLLLDSFILETSGLSGKLPRFKRKHKFTNIKVLSDDHNLMARVKTKEITPIPPSYGTLYRAMYHIKKALPSMEAQFTIENNSTLTDFEKGLNSIVAQLCMVDFKSSMK